MVEVDVQFLVGVAVTVYLALLFFGVIVLWDISLALRGVGEKIDKLEDNIDDDLTDIGYALDGMSNGPGGGGTQLHLSGGTISSGPQTPEGGMQHAPSQPHQPQEAYDPQPQASANHPHPARGESPAAPPQDEPEPQMGDESAQTINGEQNDLDEEQNELDDEEQNEFDDEKRVDEGDRADDEERDEKLEDYEVGGVDEKAETSISDRDGDTESGDASPHERRNRGRFVASPDRTPWYAVELNRDAISAAKEPTIAGELEAPETDSRDDEPEIIVAGPATESDAEEESGGTRPVDSAVPADESADVTVADDESDEEADDGYDPVDDDRETLSYNESNLERTVDNDDGQTNEEPDVDVEEPDVDVEEQETQPDEGNGVAEDRSDEEDESEEDDEVSENESEEADEVPENESEEGDLTADSDERSEAELDDVETDPFEFVEEDSDEMPSARDAAEQLNEEAPALSLSSHGFELTATVDDESAVLVFEFDPGTGDISGSTKRLLSYQLRSYADQESSPNGDVTIERNSIVVEIPDADGMAIEDWANAVVDIIDRTLYLSDNR